LLTNERLSDGLQHVLVGRDDSTHHLAGVDENSDLGRDRLLPGSIIDDNQ